MWLLNARTFQLQYFTQPNEPYTILSHTWADGEEILFHDLHDLSTARSKKSWPKLEGLCKQTIADGLKWTWIDTCCIDKSSSAELSEAINSMFSWYRSASICHVYLSDYEGPALSDDDAYKEKWAKRKKFEECRWWKRGWTLQELLAPRGLKFWSARWQLIGRLQDLAVTISRVTCIDVDVISRLTPLSEVCVARKMSWASTRRTTRIEDAAYSLLGLFGVYIPLIYGEGTRAFRRLQEEIMRKTTDLSILAWEYEPRNTYIDRRDNSLLLADSPAAFNNWFRGHYALRSISHSPFELTNAGLRISLSCIAMQDLVPAMEDIDEPWWRAPWQDAGKTAIGTSLGCYPVDNKRASLYLILAADPNSGSEPGDIAAYNIRTAHGGGFAMGLGSGSPVQRRLVQVRLADVAQKEQRSLLIRSNEPTPMHLATPSTSMGRDFVLRTKSGARPQVLDARPVHLWNGKTSTMSVEPRHGSTADPGTHVYGVVLLRIEDQDTAPFFISYIPCSSQSLERLRIGFLADMSLEDAERMLAAESDMEFWDDMKIQWNEQIKEWETVEKSSHSLVVRDLVEDVHISVELQHAAETVDLIAFTVARENRSAAKVPSSSHRSGRPQSEHWARTKKNIIGATVDMRMRYFTDDGRAVGQ